jgi:hypothetical protein
VSRAWIYKLLARYAAFGPRSKRPRSSPTGTPQPVIDRVLALRKQLAEQGLDAGPHTVCWHLRQEHLTVSVATISRILTRHGAVTPDPTKRPKSSYRRFENCSHRNDLRTVPPAPRARSSSTCALRSRLNRAR